MKIRTFEDLQARLTKRASEARSQSNTPPKAAVAGDPTPEKDPNEAGTVAAKPQPDASSTRQNMPAESAPNADATGVITPPAVARTVSGDEKVAGDLAGKVAAVTNAIRNMAKSMPVKKAESAGTALPQMPPNTQVNTPSTPSPSPKGPSGTPDPAVKGAAPEPAAKDPAQTPAPTPKPDSKGDLPKELENKDTPKPDAEKMATAEDLAQIIESWRTDGSRKLAAFMLENQGVREKVEAELEKKMGREAAEAVVKTAAIMEDLAHQADAMEDAGMLEAQQVWDNAATEDKERIIKLASALQAGRDNLKTDAEKMAFDAGAVLAGNMDDQGMLGQEAPADMSMAIEQVLGQLVAEGKISPEEAAQILQSLSGEGQEAPAAEVPGEEAPPAEEDPAASEEEKEARVNMKAAAAVITAIEGSDTTKAG